jgi:predicted RNA polymerase sigma factor
VAQVPASVIEAVFRAEHGRAVAVLVGVFGDIDVAEESTTPDGDLVRLADQDRSGWDRGLIAEGQALVRRCLRCNQPGPYQILAADRGALRPAPLPGPEPGRGTTERDFLRRSRQALPGPG